MLISAHCRSIIFHFYFWSHCFLSRMFSTDNKFVENNISVFTFAWVSYSPSILWAKFTDWCLNDVTGLCFLLCWYCPAFWCEINIYILYLCQFHVLFSQRLFSQRPRLPKVNQIYGSKWAVSSISMSVYPVLEKNELVVVHAFTIPLHFPIRK